jgi:hypothetical protein
MPPPRDRKPRQRYTAGLALSPVRVGGPPGGGGADDRREVAPGEPPGEGADEVGLAGEVEGAVVDRVPQQQPAHVHLVEGGRLGLQVHVVTLVQAGVLEADRHQGRSLQHQPVPARPWPTQVEVDHHPPVRQRLHVDVPADPQHQQVGVELGLGRVLQHPPGRPLSQGPHRGPELLTDRGQPVAARPLAVRADVLGDAETLEVPEALARIDREMPGRPGRAR